MDELGYTIKKLQKQNATYAILGDLNIDQSKITTDASIAQYFNYLNCLGFINLIQIPTRVIKTSQTIIDHCYTNNAVEIDAKVLTSDISDHFVIIAKISDSFLTKKFAMPMVRTFAKDQLVNSLHY